MDIIISIRLKDNNIQSSASVAKIDRGAALYKNDADHKLTYFMIL